MRAELVPPSLTAPAEPTAPRVPAKRRMELLFDRGSLQALRTRVGTPASGAPAPEGDGVVVATGTVEGRPVACYAQDDRVRGGSLGEAQAAAIVRLLGIARKARMPVVSFHASSGARIQEGVAGLAGYAGVFREIVSLTGVVPQVSIVTGLCAGGGAYAPALTDFAIMTEPAAMFLTGPRIVREVCGEEVSIGKLGGSRVHRSNGVCQLIAGDEEEAVLRARQLLSFVSRGAGPAALPPVADVVSPDPGALLPPRPSAPYDVRGVARALADRGELLEVDAGWARNLVTGFVRIGGHAAAVLANQPKFAAGAVDVQAADKAAAFVELCDAHALPLVVLVDTPGFMPGGRQEREAIIRRGAAVVRAFARARVPRFTVVLRKAYGGAYIAMNSLGLGATLTYAWPDAEIGVMDPYSAVGLVERAALERVDDAARLRRSLASRYRREHCTASAAARRGFVDEVIPPAQTRSRLRSALVAFASTSAPA